MKTTSATLLQITAAVCLGLACSGCSFAFSRAKSSTPDQLQGNSSAGRCTKSFAPPIVDTVLTSTHLFSALVGSQLPPRAFNETPNATHEPKTLRTALVGVDLGLAALFAASAIYGYVAVSSCHPKRHDDSEERSNNLDGPGYVPSNSDSSDDAAR